MWKYLKIKKSEIASIIAATLAIAVVVSLIETTELFLKIALIFFLILIINFAGKKIGAYR